MSSVDLLNRSLGTLTSSEFAHIQNGRLLEALQLHAWPHFGRQSMKKGTAGGQSATSGSHIDKGDDGVGTVGQISGDAIAHRAGVNAIDIDRFEGR